MVQKSINFNLAAPLASSRARAFIFAGVVSALGFSALLSSPVQAAIAADFAQPSIEFDIDKTEIESGATSLIPNNCSGDDKTCGTASFKVPIQIKVSNASKYNVSIWAEHSGLENGKTGAEAKEIPSVTTGTVLTNLSNNWGYRWTFGNTKEDRVNPYTAMPTEATLLHLGNTTDTVSSSDNLSANPTDITLSSSGTDNRYLILGFGVNIDGDTPSGTYSNKIHIATTASPLAVTLFHLDTMQQINSDICNATTTPLKTASMTDTDFTHHGDPNYVPEVTLKDSRDGKTYLVRKLADGNCWMSQNLALDFVDERGYYDGPTKSGGTMITTDDIRVNNSFKLTTSNTDLGVESPIGTNGEWVPSMASVPVFRTQISQGDSSTHPWQSHGNDGMRSFSSDVAFPDANYSVAGAIPEPLDNRIFTTASFGQPYQKYGNFYNWIAATLGSGADKDAGQDASASICPKGWRLPTTGNNVAPVQDGSIKSYLNLIRNYDNAYGTTGTNNAGTTINIASFGDDFGKMADGTYSGLTSLSPNRAGKNAYNQLAEFPLNFLRTGYYGPDKGYVDARIVEGLWWSSTAASDAKAYNLSTWGPGNVTTQDQYIRGSGRAVRCVAR